MEVFDISSGNLTWNPTKITKTQRQELSGHRGAAVWFTGLSGAGKSTLANAAESALYERGFHTYLLDGDNVRLGLNEDLSFSERDREENIRRVAQVAKLFADAGLIVIVAFISPFRRDRERARSLFSPSEFVEVFVDCPLSECMRRDPKGLYQKASAGLIPEFTGISSPYEPPENPEITVHTDRQSPAECAAMVVSHVSRLVILEKPALKE